MKSIILPTFCPTADVEHKLERCIQSILMHTAQDDMELIIVEQGIAACGHMVGTLASGKRRVTYQHVPEPIGYAKAVNMGVRMAEGEHLLIVNNDIVVPEAWAERLVYTYDSHPRLAMLSACDLPGAAAEIVEEPCSWWSCVCISRSIWDRIGPLDDQELNYRLHDQDWDIRAWRAGYSVGRYHGVRVVHDESSTYRHMGIDETQERATMRARWGHEHFVDYVRAMRPK